MGKKQLNPLSVEGLIAGIVKFTWKVVSFVLFGAFGLGMLWAFGLGYGINKFEEAGHSFSVNDVEILGPSEERKEELRQIHSGNKVEVNVPLKDRGHDDSDFWRDQSIDN